MKLFRTKSKPAMRAILSASINEKGAALVIALMFMAILGLLGTTAVVMTTTDIQIGANYKTSVQTFNAAEAGAQEALFRLRGPSSWANYAGDPATSPDPWWSAYIVTATSFQPSDDPNYNSNYTNYIPISTDHTNASLTANSLQSDILYLTKIRHKREYDAEQAGHSVATPHYYDGDGSTSTHSKGSPGNIIYRGYGDPSQPTTLVQFTGGTTADAMPVNIITAYGKSGGALGVVEVEVVRPSPPPIESPLYGKGNITINGSSGYISGDDNCGGGAPLPPIYAKSPAVVIEHPAPTYAGSPSTPVTGSLDIDISDYISDMKASATTIITSDQNGTTYGSASDFVTCYSDTSDPYNVNGLKLQNVTGYGMLLVEGDLTLGGGFSWNGLVLVTGLLTFNGGGSGINIYGAILAEQTVDVNGGLDIRYDSCMVSNALDGQIMNILSWNELGQ